MSIEKKNVKRLNQVLNFYNGNNLYSKEYIRKHPGKYPVYSSSIKNKGIIGYIDSYEFYGNFITFTTHGNPGVGFFRDSKFNISHLSIAVSIKNGNQLILKFIYYLFKSNLMELILKLKVIKQTSTFDVLNIKNFKNLNIKIPSLLVQKNFVNKVEELLSIVSNLNIIIKKLKIIINRVNSFYFKIINYIFLQNKDYKILKLKDFTKIYIGKTPSTKNLKYWDNENGINWLTIRDITKKNKITDRKITKLAIEECNLIKTNNNSLLFCFIGTLKLFIPLKNYYFNQAIADLQVNQKIIKKEFLMYSLIPLLEELKRKYRNTIMSSLNKKIINNLEIKVSDLFIQKKIINSLHFSCLKIKNVELNLNKKLLNLKNLKKTIYKLIIDKELKKIN